MTSVIRSSINYIGAIVASKFVPIVSVFVFVNFISVSEYGEVGLFASYVWIVGLLLTLNLHTSVGRFLYEAGIDIPAFLGTVMCAIFLLFAGGFLVLLASGDTLANLLRLSAIQIGLLLVVSLGQVNESILTQYIIRKQRSVVLLIALSAKALLTFCLTLFLLIVLDSGKVYAILGVDAALNFLLAIFAILYMRKDIRITIRREHLSVAFKYSFPLIPYMLSVTLISQFDRNIIDGLFGKGSTGVYSYAVNLGSMILIVSTGLLNALNPSFYHFMDSGDHAGLRTETRGVFLVTMYFTLAVVLWSREAVNFIDPSGKYAEGYPLIPVVAIGALASLLFQAWGRVFGYVKRTWIISAIAFAACAVKIAANYILLPLFGFECAAHLSLLTYLLMFILCVLAVNRAQKDLRAGLAYETIVLALLYGIAVFVPMLRLPILPLELFKLLALVVAILLTRRGLSDFIILHRKPAKEASR